MGFLECLHFLRQSVLRFSQLELQLRILRYDTNQLLLPFKHSLFRGKVTRLNRLIVRLHLLHQCRCFSILDSLGQFCEQLGNRKKSIYRRHIFSKSPDHSVMQNTGSRIITGSAMSALLSLNSPRNGGAEGIRTPDPHNAIVVLYQLSYDPNPSAFNLVSRSALSNILPDANRARRSFLFQPRNPQESEPPRNHASAPLK